MKKSTTVKHELLNIYGIGQVSCSKLLATLGISTSTLMQDLPIFKRDMLLQALAALRKSSKFMYYNSKACNIVIEKTIKKQIEYDIKRLITNQSYRGARLRMGYPVNGGRTRSNGRTSKKLRIGSI